MKKIVFIISLGLLIVAHAGMCQSKKQYTDITYLKLTDTALIKNIDTMITSLESKDTPFKKGYGYITLNVIQHSKGDTIMEYHANPTVRYLRYFSENREYPNFYSFINKRLVVIKISSLKKFSQSVYPEKVKKKIQKLVNSQLEDIDNKVFYDIRGKKVLGKNFPLDVFWIDTQVIIYVLKNKSVIVKKHY